MSLAESLVDEVAAEEAEIVEDVAVEEEAEATEPEAEETDEVEDGDEGEDLVYEIDGQEVTEQQLKEWKTAFEREQEGTKNESEYGKLKEDLDAKAQKIDQTLEALSAAESELESLVMGDLEEIDLKSLKEEDYQEYLRTKETIEDRKKQFQDIKKKAMQVQNEKLNAEQKILNDTRGWSDTKKREQDIELLNEAIKDYGLGESDVKTLTSAKVMAALFEGAKAKRALSALSKPKSKVVKKVPKSVKAKSNGSHESQGFMGRFSD